MKMDFFMKIRIALGLCLVLGAGFLSVRAADNPAQAAARRLWNKNLASRTPGNPQSLTTATNTLSEALVEQTGNSATNVTETVPEKTVAPKIAPVTTNPVAAPTAERSGGSRFQRSRAGYYRAGLPLLPLSLRRL